MRAETQLYLLEILHLLALFNQCSVKPEMECLQVRPTHIMLASHPLTFFSTDSATGYAKNLSISTRGAESLS